MSKAKDFLKASGLHESCFDFEEHVSDFTAEMEAGLAGQRSSLSMLPSYLGLTPRTRPEGAIIAVDAGGTNLRAALVSFTPGAPPVISARENFRIPGTDGPISIGTFFSDIADHIGARTEATDRIGFCFSFECEIGADRDGKILGFSKEVDVEGAGGAYIGAELNTVFARMGKPPAKITALNDTTAALIGVVVSRNLYDRSGYVGLVYGTGLNICYYDAERKMIINTEAGKYTGFRRSVCDIEVDAGSDNPGDHLFEKMVSGAYFAKVAFAAARLAAREGIFDKRTAGAVGLLDSLDIAQVDLFMRAGGGRDTMLGQCCATEQDAAILYEIFAGLYSRATKLIAIAVTAALRKSAPQGGGPALFVAEGSAFRKGFQVQERFAAWMSARPADGRSYKFILADGQTLIGAAAAVFL